MLQAFQDLCGSMESINDDPDQTHATGEWDSAQHDPVVKLAPKPKKRRRPEPEPGVKPGEPEEINHRNWAKDG